MNEARPVPEARMPGGTAAGAEGVVEHGVAEVSPGIVRKPRWEPEPHETADDLRGWYGHMPLAAAGPPGAASGRAESPAVGAVAADIDSTRLHHQALRVGRDAEVERERRKMAFEKPAKLSRGLLPGHRQDGADDAVGGKQRTRAPRERSSKSARDVVRNAGKRSEAGQENDRLPALRVPCHRSG